MSDTEVWKIQKKILKEIRKQQDAITGCIDVTEHSRIVRKALRERFPDIKFKVVSDRFAGGDSVTVYHKDIDLTREQEEEISEYVDKFDGYRGDLLDGRYNVGFVWNGERLCGASFCSYNYKWR
jgi:histone H3/H4